MLPGTGPRIRMKPEAFADPWLLWLFNTGNRYFPGGVGEVVLFVQFKKPLDAGTRSVLLESKVQISPLYEGYSYATVRLELSALAGRLGALAKAGAACITLASPTPGPKWVEPAPAPLLDGGPDRVLGIIDDGCPFAHRHYRTTGPAPFAVRFIWDQGGGGGPNPPVNYGRGLLEGELATLVGNATVGGVVDEEATYRASRLPGLRDATSHGAQVMSHATGNARPGRQPNLPGRNDIAFVQLPPDALDEPAGRWMDHYALDGIHAISFYARRLFASPARHVVVNLSYGPQTGPHDGTSIFEAAVDELTQKAQSEAWKLDVVVPSGNSHLLRAHAEFRLGATLDPLTWCLAPDSQVPSYLEIWPPTGISLAELEVSLTSPTGETITAVDQTSVSSSTATVTAGPYCGKPGQYLVLLVIAATARQQDSSLPDPWPLAVPGRWKVAVTVRPGQAAAGTVDAYLARLDPNLGRKLRGRSGYLDTPTYDPRRYLAASTHLAEPAAPPGTEVRARGSLNGIATGAKVQVAAGYVGSSQPPHGARKPSSYSSGGPSRGARSGPDFAYPTDDSPVLRGRLAGGNRSGAVTRLFGTSFAAPMYALDLLDPGLIGTLPLPNPLPGWFPRRCGNGQRKA